MINGESSGSDKHAGEKVELTDTEAAFKAWWADNGIYHRGSSRPRDELAWSVWRAAWHASRDSAPSAASTSIDVAQLEAHQEFFERTRAQSAQRGSHAEQRACEFALEQIRRVQMASPSSERSSAPLGYCLVNAKGEMFWEEYCIYHTPGEAAAERETLHDADPEAGWRVSPFYPAPVSHERSSDQPLREALAACARAMKNEMNESGSWIGGRPGSKFRDAQAAAETLIAASAIEAPDHENIADMLKSWPASERCPLCGQHGQHDHTPAEIVIYRNGVKYGRSIK
jgi:hypothetical protein